MATNSLPASYAVPSGKVARGTASVPPSKSLAHRALICAALARGDSRVGPLPDGEDVAATLECLRACGVGIRGQGTGDRGQETGGSAVSTANFSLFTFYFSPQETGDGGQEASRTVLVAGTSGRLTAPRVPLNCRASGTTLRLLMGVCGAMEGAFTLDGEEQLRRRPVGDMDAPLVTLGASLKYAEREGFPPVVVEGCPWPGGRVTVPGSVSSQFLSGLLMGAPLAHGPVTFESAGLVSAPYAKMTAAVMATFGAAVDHPGEFAWRVAPGAYRAMDFTIEPDASSAAFMWAAAAVTEGEVLVRGTTAPSLQGDALFPGLLAQMGCRVERTAEGTAVSGSPSRGLDADLSGTPDLVPALAAVAAFAPAPSTFRGVAHLRFKESDRLAVLSDGLSRLGATVLIEAGRMTLIPCCDYRGAELDPRGDHRMAMAFAILGLRIPGVTIKGPACVAKSFPAFFAVLEGLLV